MSSTKKVERKATIKTNSPNKTVLAALFMGKNHPLYIQVTFIYSLLWLVSILGEILQASLYRKHYILNKKIDNFKNLISLEVVTNLSTLPVSYTIASGAKTRENEKTKFSDPDI